MKKFFLLYIVYLLSVPFVFCQSDIAQLSNKVTENISLTTDRDFYITGEKVWFKAQGFVQLDEVGAQLSNVLYVELFNESNQSFVKKKFKVSNGMVAGMFSIPGELKSGNYLIRVYTQYHRNSLPESFTTYYITIINPALQLTEKLIIPKSIEILPEFGFLFDNIQNKVAVNLLPSERNSVSSWLEDDNKNKIADVNFENGMAVMQFVPNIDLEYALYTIEDNDTIITKLPKARRQGTVMSVSESNFNDQMDLAIISQQSSPQQLKVGIYSTHFNKTFDLDVLVKNGTNHFSIPSNLLNTGFTYFVLKNEQNEIVNIYSYFNFQKEIVKLEINPDKQNYKRRDKIELELSSSLSDLDLSITVVKKGAIADFDKSLPRYLVQNPQLLESYLHSNPEINLKNLPELEVLLIKYNSQLANNSDLKTTLKNFNYDIDWVPEIRDVSLSGYVRTKNTHQAVANVEVYASIFKTSPQVHLYKTDEKGFFIFSLNNLRETQDVFLSINNKMANSEELEIFVNNDFSTSYPTINPIPLSIDSSQIAFIEEMYVSSQASKVFNTEVGNVAKPAIKLPFSFMNPEFSINLDEYVDSESLEVVFRELIPSVRARREGDNFVLKVTDPVSWEFQANPLIMVDYITIFDVNEVMAINPNNIHKINVYSTPFVIGESQFNGVILITTKTDDFGKMKMPAESVFFEYTTISNSYNFDPPSYENNQKVSSRKADFRNLLYWDAELKLKDKKSISFYASDDCSEYEIIVRGKTKDGRWCYGKSSIEVIK